MRVLCLTDFVVPAGRRWIWDYLPANDDEIEFLYTTTQDQFPGWGKLLGYYPALLKLGQKAIRRVRQEKFDLVIAWEGKNGFPLALYRRLLGQHLPPFVILEFSIRGPLKRLGWLQRYGVRGMDYATVPTRYEQHYYSQRLGIPLERILHCPIGTHDVFAGLPASSPGDFIFTGGRSGRDYRTFLAAISGLPIRAVVNARPFNLENLDIPANVKVNDILPWQEYRDLNRSARFVVVPLQLVDEAVGLTAILYGMAAGRPVIATNTPGSAEYVVEGETGLLAPPGDVQALRQAIQYLWERPELCEQMGRRARQVYEERYNFTSFAFRTYQILTKIYQDSLAARPFLRPAAD